MRARQGPCGHDRRLKRGRLSALAATVVLAAAAALTGCGSFSDTVPACADPLRVAIIAQSVPDAAYLPCIRDLPTGWNTAGFDPTRDGTSFRLDSDRSPGQPVTVRLTAACQTAGASPSPARAPGVLTYTRLSSISPGFAGTLYDEFPGGCVSYSFDFTLGSQIALMEQFEEAVGLYPRQQLRLVLKQELGVELDP
jgi:hypothetical protein